jgi:hypothetical protein
MGGVVGTRKGINVKSLKCMYRVGSSSSSGGAKGAKPRQPDVPPRMQGSQSQRLSEGGGAGVLKYVGSEYART